MSTSPNVNMHSRETVDEIFGDPQFELEQNKPIDDEIFGPKKPDELMNGAALQSIANNQRAQIGDAFLGKPQDPKEVAQKLEQQVIKMGGNETQYQLKY